MLSLHVDERQKQALGAEQPERDGEHREEPILRIPPESQEEQPCYQVTHHDEPGAELEELHQRRAAVHRVSQISPYKRTHNPKTTGNVRRRTRSCVGPATTLSSTS